MHHALSLAGGHPLPLLVALSLLARLDLAKGRWNSDAARFAPVQTTRTAIARDTSALDFDRVYFLARGSSTAPTTVTCPGFSDHLCHETYLDLRNKVWLLNGQRLLSTNQLPKQTEVRRCPVHDLRLRNKQSLS
jgi:hypothetical protein